MKRIKLTDFCHDIYGEIASWKIPARERALISDIGHDMARIFLYDIERKNVRYKAIHCNNAIVGYITAFIYPDDRILFINNVFVLPGYRRKSIAKKALNMFSSKSAIDSRSVNRLECYINENNMPSRKLFESAGFRIAKRNDDGVLVMEKQL